MAPNAPSGAAFMMMPMTVNIACAASSISPRSAWARSPILISAKPEQHREEQHLQNIADLEDLRAVTAGAGLGRGDEGADDAVGDDVQDVIDRVELGGGLGVALGLLGLVGGDLRRKACPWPPQHADDDADQEGEAGDEF